MKKKQYFCIVFFMVLDLRLSKRLGCRETTCFFLCVFLFLTHLIQQKLNNSHFFLTFRLRVSIFFCNFVPDFVVL